MRGEVMKRKRQYEAPEIRDLEELGLEGQFPLGENTCSVGDVGTNTCYNGTNTGTNTCSTGPCFPS
jgi:hypothetical protein